MQSFEQQVQRTPDALAVVMGEQSLTYLELNRRANQLAHYLRARGVGCETLVGICVERSLAMLVGVLGTLKAGGAYLPMDPTYPVDRLRFIQDDARLQILLTQEALRQIAADHTTEVVCLDGDWGRISQCSPSNPVPVTSPDNLAYVIYTSGSTGKPKGVMVCRQGLTNYLQWCVAVYGVAEGQGAPVHSSIGFDLTVTSLFSPLLVGKTVFLLPNEIEALANTMCDAATDFSLVKITPAHLQLLQQSLNGREVLGKIRGIVVGGEVLASQDVASWRRKAPDSRIINEYGPTETVVGCMNYEVPADVGDDLTVPIGAAIANTRVYVLDDNLTRVPVGVSGNLYVGGDGVARGYLNRPDLTAARFVPDPFGDDGTRLYSTGDQARYRPDGAIEFLGRADQQVKIFGYRIELGEIDVILRECSGVQQAAASVREVAGSPQLIGYVVATAPSQLDLGEMRSALRQKLPEYMVPSRLVQLPALPMTVNGKLDRKRLAEHIEVGSVTADDQRSNQPEDGEESRMGAQRLARWIAEVLGRPHVGVHDSISELGMKSLQIARLLGRIRSDLGVELTFGQVLEMQTAARLANLLGKAPTVEAPRLQSRPDAPRIPLSTVQFPYWFHYQIEPDDRLTDNHLCVRLSGPLDRAILHRALDAMYWRHDVLRATFPLDRSGTHQVSSPRGQERFPLCVIDLPSVAVPSAAEIFRAASLPMDLLRGPVICGTLFSLAGQNHFLLIVAHPIVADGLSLEVMVKDLAALYRSLTHGGATLLPALAVQYGDFTIWETERLTPDMRRRQEVFWKRQLAPPVPALAFPEMGTGPAGAIRRHRVRLTLAERRSLEAFAAKEQCSLFTVLLAGIKVLLAEETGQTDLVVCVVVANRPDPLLDDLIGAFADVLPIRTSLNAATTFRSVLDRVRRSLLAAFDHPDLRLHEILRLVRVLSGAKDAHFCDVLLNLLEAIPDEHIGALRMQATASLRDCGIDELYADVSAAATPAASAVTLQPVCARRAAFKLYFTGILDELGLELELAADASLFNLSMAQVLLERLVDLLVRGASCTELTLAMPSGRGAIRDEARSSQAIEVSDGAAL